MPSRPTVRRWLAEHEPFRRRYAEARALAGTGGSGRPSSYSKDLAQRICAAIAAGNSVSAACARPGMPARMTVFNWLAQRADFRESYALARRLHADALVDEILEIADTATDPRRAWVRIDARKQAVARLRLQKHGGPSPAGNGTPGLEAMIDELDREAAQRFGQGAE